MHAVLKDWKPLIFDPSIPFDSRCRPVFEHQIKKNPVYRRFVSVLGFQDPPDKDKPVETDEIPLLPIRAFKQSRLICEGTEPELAFRSSGTGDMERSTHFIADTGLYKEALRREFYSHFPEKEYAILAYTPGYSDNAESSLIWMINDLIRNDKSGLSRFLPLNRPLKKEDLEDIFRTQKKILLFGAAFGLLDLVELQSDPLPKNAEVLETGGMKTHRREMTRQQLRKELSRGLGVKEKSIHSEYGMCELLSQCYALGGEWFSPPHWMRVSVRRADDPIKVCRPGEEGKVGVADLANVHSCSFILTEDRGVADEHGRFKVLGRWSPADMRGCNFLIDRE